MVKLKAEDAIKWMDENIDSKTTRVLKSYSERYFGISEYIFALMADFANEKIEEQNGEETE